MAVPTFNSLPIFGIAVRMTTALNPREEQRVAAPGVNNVASLAMGARGRVTTATGVLTGASLLALNLNISAFESFFDGRAYVLATNDGRVWPNVKLARFEPQGRYLLDAKWGYVRAYQAEFFHLQTF